MFKRRSEQRVQLLLIVGFLLIIFILFADGFVGVRSILSMQKTVSRLVDDHARETSLINEVRREQDALIKVSYYLSGDPDSPDRGTILNQIIGVEQNMHKIAAAAPVGDPERRRLLRIASSSTAFVTEARRILSPEDPPTVFSRKLLRRHDEVINAVADLVQLSNENAKRAKAEIESRFRHQIQKDTVLLGGCLVLVCLCAALVVRAASQLQRQMNAQSIELSRVSWQLLNNQEMMARRLSHELHDELGQTLTALKTNITRHATAPCVDPSWLQDCSELLKESIRNSHEISQLLHPTILDDFGLEYSLAWLCERFQERNGIDVEFSSAFKGRLTEETETHLFRIAQEALTNVVRHSGATVVSVRVRQQGKRLCLSIQDNGKGLPPSNVIRKGLGLTGMQARARSAGGELMIRSRAQQGVSIEVWTPLERKRNEEDSNLAG